MTNSGSWKQKRQILKQHLSSPFPRSSFSPSHQTPLPPSHGCRGMGNGVVISPEQVLYHSFLLTLFTCFCVCPLMGCRAISAPVPWSTSFSSSSDLGVSSAVSPFFSPSSLPAWHILLFLNCVFPEAPPS